MRLWARVAIIAAAFAVILGLLNSLAFLPRAQNPRANLPSRPEIVRAAPPRPPTLDPAPEFPRSAMFQAVDAALGRMVDAQVAFTAPERMRIGQTLAVQAILAPGVDADLANRLIGLLTAQGRREVAQLRASDRMRATLTGGTAFEVTPSGPQMQFVGSKEPTVWHWEAAAKMAGKHELTLGFEAIISVNSTLR